MGRLTFKTCAHFAVLILGAVICYLANINLGSQPFNGADAAFLLLALTSVYMLTRVRIYAHKGFEAYRAMKIAQETAQSTILCIMQEFPEEERNAVLARVQTRAIQNAINELKKAVEENTGKKETSQE